MRFASPTIGMCAGTFLEISAGSMSMWMNFARGANSRQLAGDAVVEAGADRDDQVGLVHRVVGRAGAVHAEHPEPLLVRRRERAEAHQRAGDREVAAERELAQLLRRVGVDHAAAGVEHRPARVGHRLGGEPDLLGVALDRRLVAGQVDVLDRLVVDLGAA